MLREQLHYIREELGEEKPFSDTEQFEEALQKLEAPEEVKENQEGNFQIEKSVRKQLGKCRGTRIY